MPRSLRAAGCMRTSISNSTNNQAVWISDDLLTETFRNFTHRHRRYGSNVPGPLEARRRAAKRRNTNLAYIDRGVQQLDPALIFSSKPPGEWWQRSETSVPKPTQRLFPTWLFELSAHGDNRGAQEQICEKEVSAEEFQQYIQQCSRLKSIRKVVENNQINLRQRPDLAETAFRHVLNMYWSDGSNNTTTLIEFLADPNLNPPGSSNHLILAQELCIHPVSRKTWETLLFPAIQNSVQLGLIEVDGLQQIIRLLPQIHTKSGFTLIRDGEKLISDYHRILTSIEDSGVLRLEHLEDKFGRLWYDLISQGAPTDNAISLMWRLRRFAGKDEVNVVTELVASKLQHLVREGITATEKFKTWMATLPQDVRGLAVLRTSQTLVASAISGELSTAEIEQWYETFSSLNGDVCVHVTVDQKAWNEALCSQSTLTPGQNILTLAWTVMYLASNQTDNSQLLSSFGFKEQFSKAFTDQKNEAHTQMLGHIVMTLDTLPLPGKDKLYWHLESLKDRNLMTMLGHRVYAEDVQSLTNRDLTKLNDDRFYRWAKHNSSDVIANLSSSATKDIAMFRDLAHNLIMKNKNSFRIVNRILDHSLSMKLALPLCSKFPSSQKDTCSDRLEIDPIQAVDLIHHLAIAFAVTPVVGPRSSFRQVYRMYLYLHRYGAPIQPLMARALWHAGVTRYGKDGTSDAQLKWCLQKIREIEGQETASMLLWSAGFRRLRDREMETYESSATRLPALPSVLSGSESAKDRTKS